MLKLLFNKIKTRLPRKKIFLEMLSFFKMYKFSADNLIKHIHAAKMKHTRGAMKNYLSFHHHFT